MKRILILALLFAPIGAIAAEGSVVGHRAHDITLTNMEKSIEIDASL